MGKLEQSTVHTGEGSGDIQSRAVAGGGICQAENSRWKSVGHGTRRYMTALGRQ